MIRRDCRLVALNMAGEGVEGSRGMGECCFDVDVSTKTRSIMISLCGRLTSTHVTAFLTLRCPQRQTNRSPPSSNTPSNTRGYNSHGLYRLQEFTLVKSVYPLMAPLSVRYNVFANLVSLSAASVSPRFVFTAAAN